MWERLDDVRKGLPRDLRAGEEPRDRVEPGTRQCTSELFRVLDCCAAIVPSATSIFFS